MAFNFNGNTPTAINFNGQEVTTLQFNGVTVWTAQKEYNLGSYGDIVLTTINDGDGNITYTDAWANGSVLVAMSGQTLTVSFGFSAYHNGHGGYCDIYLRDTSGNRTKLARLAQKGNWDGVIAEDLTSPKSFALPSSGNYYIDFYCMANSYLSHACDTIWSINSVMFHNK